MDKLINTHVDKIEQIQDEFAQDLDKIIQTIDIDAVLYDPESEMMRVADIIAGVLIDDYAPRAVDEGFKFYEAVDKRIDQDKEIVIDDSKNPKLNAQN